MPTDPSLSILALHGNGGGGFRFALARPHFPDDVRFEAPSLPGFEGVPLGEARTLADYAACAWRFADALPGPVVLLGTGIGGTLILEMLQTRLAPAILHAPVGARLDTRLFPRLMKRPAVRKFGKRLFASRPLRPVWRRLLFRAPALPGVHDRFFDAYRTCEAFSLMFDLITPAWFEGLRPADVPATLLWGEHDRVLTPDQAADFRRVLPRAETRIEPGWAHFPMIDAPAEYARVVTEEARRLLA